MTSNEKVRRAIKGEHVDGVSYVLAIKIERMVGELRDALDTPDRLEGAMSAVSVLDRWEDRYGLPPVTLKGGDNT